MRMDIRHMPLNAGQGDKISLSIGLSRRGISEVRDFGGDTFVACDALRNLCDRLFVTYAESLTSSIFAQREFA